MPTRTAPRLGPRSRPAKPPSPRARPSPSRRRRRPADQPADVSAPKSVASTPLLSNAEIAQRLTSLAQLLSARRENPFKIKAYRRAAETITHLSESVDALVRNEADLTAYSGIGKGIAGAVREIVLTGSLRQLDTLRSEVSPELAALTEHPRLDPRRVQQAYKKLGISTLAELQEKIAAGEVAPKLGSRMEQHFRYALSDVNEQLLYDTHDIAAAVQLFLIEQCGAARAEPAGAYRRCLEVIGELSFLIEADDFPRVVAHLKRYGGRAELITDDAHTATFKLGSGLFLRIENVAAATWGLALIVATGSEEHLEKLAPHGLAALARSGARLPDEAAVYRKLGLAYIPPELRAGHDEVERAARGTVPELVTRDDIRGELHAHTTSSDGTHTIEQMAAAARDRGYDYLGITDHSQSLKIAGGLSEEELWKQIRRIDRLNARLDGFRLLKSAEVDIRVDGTLDYPDALLSELDYTVCSIHSRFNLNREQQTERILRAMDNRHFNLLGHATGRLLLRRPGYEIDVARIVAHAKACGCCFEINSSPDRLDLRPAHARLAHEAGVKIAICTDAHSIRELDYMRCGIEQARRAGLAKADILNCLSWPELKRALKRKDN